MGASCGKGYCFVETSQKEKRKPRNLFGIALTIVAVVSYSSFAYMSTVPPGRFVNHVFNNVTRTNGVKYGSALNPLNNNAQKDLYFDVYEPAGDTCSARPCVVCMYGGGFTGGDRTGPGGGQDANTLAGYGYVGVAPDYRMWGNQDVSIFPVCFEVTDQDARACIRYLRAHASTYRIDTSRIAITGCSSGGFLALNVAYMDKNSKIPSIIDTMKYGGLEGTDGTPGVNSRVCAVAANSGAMLDTSWIEAGSAAYMAYQSFPDAYDIPTASGIMWTYWKFFGVDPISQRCAHLGILAGLQSPPGVQHCAGGFGDAMHMFLYNAFSEVGRKSGANTNLAINKTASQSSTSGAFAASRAVDGNIDGSTSANSFCQTNSTAQPWWQVDLGSLNIVDSVYAYNRIDNANSQTNYNVKYSMDGTNWECCAYENGVMATPSKYRIRGGILARYIRIQLRGTSSLSLAEVSVWGRDTANASSSVLDQSNLREQPVRTASLSYLVRIDNGSVTLPQQLRGSYGDVAVYNLMGQLASRGDIKEGKLQSDRSAGMKPGIYLVKISAQK